MVSKSVIKRRSLRLFAIPLIVTALAALLTELDIIPWTKLWTIPPLIALYVGVELLAAGLSFKRRRSRAKKKK
jgi:hypothetical protein